MKVFRCCAMNFFQWRLHPKYPMIAVFQTLMMWNLTNGFSRYAAHVGANIHPWLFPFLPGSGLNFLMLILPYILLVCDAPFRNGQQQFVIQRVGKTTWICGQLLFIFLAAFLYTAFLWMLSWIYLFPNLEWSADWGAVLHTAAKLKNCGEYSDLQLNYEVIKNFSANFSCCWVFFMMIFILFFMGECMTFCNLYLSQSIGAALNITILLLNFMICFRPYDRRMLVWISPISWLNLSMVGRSNQGLPPFRFAVACILGLCAFVGCAIVGMIHRCNLVVETE